MIMGEEEEAGGGGGHGRGLDVNEEEGRGRGVGVLYVGVEGKLSELHSRIPLALQGTQLTEQ